MHIHIIGLGMFVNRFLLVDEKSPVKVCAGKIGVVSTVFIGLQVNMIIRWLKFYSCYIFGLVFHAFNIEIPEFVTAREDRFRQIHEFKATGSGKRGFPDGYPVVVTVILFEYNDQVLQGIMDQTARVGKGKIQLLPGGCELARYRLS